MKDGGAVAAAAKNVADNKVTKKRRRILTAPRGWGGCCGSDKSGGKKRCWGLVSKVWSDPCMLARQMQKTAAVLVGAKNHQTVMGVGAGHDVINCAREFAA